MIHPDWLNHILAKSADRSENGQPETLAQHTWLVLSRLSEFIHMRPNLPHEMGQPRLWTILFWATFLHDFGKAAGGFQTMLKTKVRWPYRHEVLSLAFVDWLVQGLNDEEKLWLVAAIVSHHKDISYIKLNYANPRLQNQIVGMVAELDEATLPLLWQWLEACPVSWLEALNLHHLNIELLPLMSQPDAVRLIPQQGAKRIGYWIRRYVEFVEDELAFNSEPSLTIGTLTLRGYLTNADHSASSHLGAFQSLRLIREQVLIGRDKPLTWETLHAHQRQIAETVGSALLTAPTGSGKTEAALLWAAKQVEIDQSPRLFYTLPFQASMNAMKLRLDKETFRFEKEAAGQGDYVGLQHGRSAIAYYRHKHEEAEEEGKPLDDVVKQVNVIKNMIELNYPPVRIFSPYQMLKGPFRLRGYERLLSDYHHALFIFDEIHAYEAKRVALILETMRYLRQYFQARFLVMSATFPDLIQTKLREVLEVQNSNMVKADKNLYTQKEFQRHILKLRDGLLMSDLATIAEVAKRHKLVLVVCNLVSHAQQVYRDLRNMLPSQHELRLFHGRFNMRDRLELEKLVAQKAKANDNNNEQQKSLVLVATQVVEVSLDVDFDVIYSEPAPLDALIQRFGRVNRRGKKGPSEVWVYRAWEEKQKYVYNLDLVTATMQILEREQDRVINEEVVGDWLNEIYVGKAEQTWLAEYEKSATDFRRILADLRAFEATPVSEQAFYRLFDGTEVLPVDLQGEYDREIKAKQFWKAQRLLVPISHGKLKQLQQYRPPLATNDYDKWPWVVHLPYTDEGLDLTNLPKTNSQPEDDLED